MTPQLRFPEFADEWQVKKLGEVVGFKNGKPFEDYVNESGDYSLITIDSVDINGKLKNRFKKVTKSDNSLKKNDIVTVLSDIAHGELLGLTSLIPADDKFVLNQRMGRLRPRDGNLPSFLSHYINTRQLYYRKHGQGTSQRHIYERDINQMPINLPSIREQEKIADFLTVVDERIAASERKCELLTRYKRGVMQQLFSQKIRFKKSDGSNYTDWQEEKIGELCETAKSGGTPTATNRKYYDGGEIPFLAISDITQQGKFLTKTSKFITEDGLKNSASWIVPENSIIYSMYASVGFPAINKIPIATSQAVINLIPNDRTTTEFLYYFLLNYKRFVHKFIETGTQGNLNAQSVKNIIVSLPSREEQQKIADFLTTLDNRITTERTKLTAAKQFKNALLQRMFI